MKIVFFILAWISFALGAIGAFVPILPTTPFLILAAFLFSKSSPRFHAWIMRLPMAGEAVRDWQENRVIKGRAKILCAIMIFVSLTLIWIKAEVAQTLKIFLTLLLVSVGLFVVTRKSK